MKFDCQFLLVLSFLSTLYWVAPRPAVAQSAPPVQTGSATFLRPDVHHPSRNSDTPIGTFDGQSDIGSAQVEGGALYDRAANQYTIKSAGYNPTYTREEFRFLWKKMSGDVAIAADIAFPNGEGYDGRKAVLAIRQGLEDDSKEAIVGVYGTGRFSLSQRPHEGKARRDETFQVWGAPPHARPDKRAVLMPRRMALEKHGDTFILYVSIEGEPMHPFGSPLILHLDQPFYVGIGFCSNMPDKSDTAIFSNVAAESLPRQSGTPTP
jgi:hypothetical protein